MTKSQAQQEREFEEMEAYAQALENLAQELLGLAELAKTHFGHYNEAWEKRHQQLKEQANHLLYPEEK